MTLPRPTREQVAAKAVLELRRRQAEREGRIPPAVHEGPLPDHPLEPAEFVTASQKT